MDEVELVEEDVGDEGSDVPGPVEEELVEVFVDDYADEFFFCFCWEEVEAFVDHP